MALDLQNFEFPGVTPSRQKRSRETTAALLHAGAEMLRKRSLDELSIEGLCSEVDATVGAFYSRFESKEVYFNTLLELAARDGKAMLAYMAQNEQLEVASLDRLCSIFVNRIIGFMQRHEGVLRAALKRNEPRAARWNAFQGLARVTIDQATPHLLRAMGRDRRVSKQKTIAFAFQVIFGTLVNAVLNDPGPVSIGDREMANRLQKCLVMMLEAEISSKQSKDRA